MIGVNVVFANNTNGSQNRTYMQTSPSQKLIVDVDEIKAGKLVFVAWGHDLKPPKGGSDDPCAVTVNDNRKFILDKPDNKQTSIDFWKVRRVHVEEHANMKISMVDQKVMSPAMPSYKDEGITSSNLVAVPTAVLTRDVKRGDELVLFVPKAKQEEKKRPQNIVFAPASKKVKA